MGRGEFRKRSQGWGMAERYIFYNWLSKRFKLNHWICINKLSMRILRTFQWLEDLTLKEIASTKTFRNYEISSMIFQDKVFESSNSPSDNFPYTQEKSSKIIENESSLHWLTTLLQTDVLYCALTLSKGSKGYRNTQRQSMTVRKLNS